MNEKTIFTQTIQTPLGEMTAGVRNDQLCFLEFSNPDRLQDQNTRINPKGLFDISESDHPLFSKIHWQLDAYFSGELQEFNLPVDLTGTAFHTRTWRQLQHIAYGNTISYIELAQRLGDIKKVRAVGRANGANQIAIVIPCHRVIGKDGSLVGYAGELWRKRKLLDLEATHSGTAHQLSLDI